MWNHRFYGISFHCKVRQLRFAETALLQLNSESTRKLGGQLLFWGSRGDHLTFFKAKEAVWPPRTSLTGILLRWMDLTAIGRKLPRGSGPSSRVSFSLIRPLSVVPETTVPTPYAKKEKTVIVVTQPGQQKSSRTLLSRGDTFFNLKEGTEHSSKYQAPYRDRVSIIYLEFCWLFFPVTGPWRQEIKKHLQQI